MKGDRIHVESPLSSPNPNDDDGDDDDNDDDGRL